MDIFRDPNLKEVKKVILAILATGACPPPLSCLPNPSKNTNSRAPAVCFRLARFHRRGGRLNTAQPQTPSGLRPCRWSLRPRPGPARRWAPSRWREAAVRWRRCQREDCRNSRLGCATPRSRKLFISTALTRRRHRQGPLRRPGGGGLYLVGHS